MNWSFSKNSNSLFLFLAQEKNSRKKSAGHAPDQGCKLLCSFLLKERNRKFKAAKNWLGISFEMLWKLNSPAFYLKILNAGSDRNFHLTHFSFIPFTPIF
jgi:hypothetical protein